jgi:hypothetical protein
VECPANPALQDASSDDLARTMNFKRFTRYNYRKGLIRWTGTDPGRAFQAHHVFPKSLEPYFKKIFAQAGVNIHDPRYMAWWERVSHNQNKDLYNDKWLRFLLDPNQSKTVEETLKFGRQLMDSFGLKVSF